MFRRKSTSDTDFIEHDHDLQDIELTITGPCCRQFNELFTDNILNLLTLLQITRLNIPYHDFSISILTDLLHHLPNLHTLRVFSLSLQKPLCIPDEQALVNINKITKINIQSLTELSQLQYLLDLCPNIQHLQINDLDNIDIKLVLKLILTKKSNHITLSRHIPTANQTILEEIQNMTNSEILCHDYMIKCSYNKIDFQWK